MHGDLLVVRACLDTQITVTAGRDQAVAAERR